MQRTDMKSHGPARLRPILSYRTAIVRAAIPSRHGRTPSVWRCISCGHGRTPSTAYRRDAAACGRHLRGRALHRILWQLEALRGVRNQHIIAICRS